MNSYRKPNNFLPTDGMRLLFEIKAQKVRTHAADIV